MLHMKPAYSSEHVSIVQFPETRVAVLEHHGDPQRLFESIRNFIEWRRQNQLLPSVSATFNLLYGGPDDTPPERFRLDLCAATDREVAENAYGIAPRIIPAGRCARLRHVGSDDTLGATLHYLYATWLPDSGEEPRDFPLFLQRVRFFPNVPENEAIVDVFLPLR